MSGLHDGDNAAKYGVKVPKIRQQGMSSQCFLACPDFQHVWYCLGLGMASLTFTFSKPIRTEAGIDLLSKVMQAHVSVFPFLEFFLNIVTLETGIFCC